MESPWEKGLSKMEWRVSRGGNPPAKGENMVKNITLDSSVIVSSLLEKELRHKEAFETSTQSPLWS